MSVEYTAADEVQNQAINKLLAVTEELGAKIERLESQFSVHKDENEDQFKALDPLFDLIKAIEGIKQLLKGG